MRHVCATVNSLKFLDYSFTKNVSAKLHEKAFSLSFFLSFQGRIQRRVEGAATPLPPPPHFKKFPNLSDSSSLSLFRHRNNSTLFFLFVCLIFCFVLFLAIPSFEKILDSLSAFQLRGLGGGGISRSLPCMRKLFTR